MVNRLLQPQEIEVFYVLPAIRRELAMFMKAEGKSQKEIAKLLSVTEPAVSQYISSKRAAELKFNDALKAEVKLSAQRITSETSLMREVQRLLNITRQQRLVCRMHEALGTVPKKCSVCFDHELIQLK